MTRLYFLLEHLQNGSLSELLMRECVLSPAATKHFIGEILYALRELRENEIIHRDLKPANILLDENYHIKLIDFGTAKLMNPELAAKVPLKKV